MHPRKCRCGECQLIAQQEARAGQEIYRFFRLGRFRHSFREVNLLWVTAIKEERWEALDPAQSQRFGQRWEAAPDNTKRRIKEMCDVVLL